MAILSYLVPLRCSPIDHVECECPADRQRLSTCALKTVGQMVKYTSCEESHRQQRIITYISKFYLLLVFCFPNEEVSPALKCLFQNFQRGLIYYQCQ